MPNQRKIMADDEGINIFYFIEEKITYPYMSW